MSAEQRRRRRPLRTQSDRRRRVYSFLRARFSLRRIAGARVVLVLPPVHPLLGSPAVVAGDAWTLQMFDTAPELP